MGEVISMRKSEEKNTEVIEVATNQLTVHSKQDVFSPLMSKNKWRNFVKGVKENGILQPITVTKGFRVVDGKHRLLAAKELGIESVRIVIEDIPENEVASYIVENKLNRSELKNGQRAALVILLFYEEESEKAKANSLANLKQNTESANLHSREISGEVADNLSKKSGISKRSIYSLIAVYRNRSDLFEKVRIGEYAINKAYTQLKADEEPEQEEVTPSDVLRNRIEAQIEADSSQPQYDENEHELSPKNKSVRLRRDALSMSAQILSEATTIEKTKGDVRESTRSQLLSLASSCIIALGQTSKNQDEQDLLYMGMELFKKIEGEC